MTKEYNFSFVIAGMYSAFCIVKDTIFSVFVQRNDFFCIYVNE